MTPGLGQASPGRGLGTQPGLPCQWLGPSCWSHHLLPTGRVLAGDLETWSSSPRCVAGTQLLEPWTCCLPRSSLAGTRSGVGTQTQALRGTTWVFVVTPNIYPQILGFIRLSQQFGKTIISHILLVRLSLVPGLWLFVWMVSQLTLGPRVSYFRSLSIPAMAWYTT